MPNALQMAGATAEPSNFVPLHTNRIFTGLWTNRSPMRDAATSDFQEHYGMGRQDSVLAGQNSEITPRLTLARRPGSSIYSTNGIPPVKRFYSFNTFTITTEVIRVMADTANAVYDYTVVNPADPDPARLIFTKSAGAGPTFFLGVGNTLYMTNGVDNKQVTYDPATDTWGPVTEWGIDAPTKAPTITQQPRPNPPAPWRAGTGYPAYNSVKPGLLILDDSTSLTNFSIIPTQTGGNVAIGCGQNATAGSTITLPQGFTAANMLVWTTAAVGGPTENTSGVYQSSGPNGVLNSSFQSTSGTLGFPATTNWIAIAWDAASGITATTVGNYTQITFVTALGDTLVILAGHGAQGTLVPVPSGMTTANAIYMSGMVGTDTSTGHIMQGVGTCYVFVADAATARIENNYNDNDGNVWTGTSSVLAFYWNPAERITTTPAINSTALLIPVTTTGGGGYLTLLFAPNLAQGSSFGIAGQTLASATAAMSGWTASGTNHGEGFSCLCVGTTFMGYYMDGSGNQWAATGNCFGITSYNVALSGNIQLFNGNGVTGAQAPATWGSTVGAITTDGSVSWVCQGPYLWVPGHAYKIGDAVMGNVSSPPGTPPQFFVCTTPGQSAAQSPKWVAGVGQLVPDNTAVWTNQGRALSWNDLGANTPIVSTSEILDPNGYLQNVSVPGKSGKTIPNPFSTVTGAFTTDNTVTWTNGGPWAVAGTATTLYGYAYASTDDSGNFIDISNMSPASLPITIIQGSQMLVTGPSSTDSPYVSTVIVYRTAQGGSTFLYDGQVPNTPGTPWTFVDTNTDDELNTEIQAQVNGEGTPLPVGTTCLGYHLTRIFAAVENVVWISSGPDAVVSGSSGNAGFDTFFTCQSKIIRFWACSLGMVVFTVRDAYIILGSATDADPLYMVVFIEDLPLKSYDCWTINKTTPYLLLGNNQLVSLDPSAGIIEVGFPIADRLMEEYDPTASYLTYHSQSSLDTALYIANGSMAPNPAGFGPPVPAPGQWYRMAQNNAPEQGSAWSTKALVSAAGCVQSVEVYPGTYRLLIAPTTASAVLQRDRSKNTDNGTTYPVQTVFGSIVLAQPGQLAALSFITLESMRVGTRAGLALLLGEIFGEFETLNRTHQDPPILPPSNSLYSDRYNFAQSQNEAWCRHFQMEITWPAEDAANELLTFTIFGQTWQEMRSQ